MNIGILQYSQYDLRDSRPLKLKYICFKFFILISNGSDKRWQRELACTTELFVNNGDIFHPLHYMVMPIFICSKLGLVFLLIRFFLHEG
jgi:hypothetical protein